MSQTFILNLAKLPSNLDFGYRLGDQCLIYDNLEDSVVFPAEHGLFPVKCETFFSLTVVAGSVHLEVNMHELTVQEGQTLQLMPGSIFLGISVTPDFKFYAIVVDPRFFEQMRQHIGLQVNPTHRYYAYHVHNGVPDMLWRSRQMYTLIKSEMKAPDYRYKHDVIQRYCEIWILKILSTVQRPQPLPERAQAAAQHSAQDAYRFMGRKAQIFHDFIALLAEHCVTEHNMAFYARQMSLTPKYLSNTVKEVSGKSGLRWIDEYVLLEAKALLRSGNITVKEVSQHLNYPSQSMFGRFFKKMTGYSPHEYQLL